MLIVSQPMKTKLKNIAPTREPDHSGEPAHVRALRDAVEHGGGSQVALSEGIAAFMKRPAFGQSTISYWLSAQTLLEAKWWPAIEHCTKGRVTREQLRPDVFGKQRRRAA